MGVQYSSTTVWPSGKAGVLKTSVGHSLERARPRQFDPDHRLSTADVVEQ